MLGKRGYEVKERRDFLWQTTSVDQNQDHRRRNMEDRQYGRSMVLNSTPKLVRRVAKQSKRNEDHNSTLRLGRKGASPPNVNRDRNSTQKSGKRVESEDEQSRKIRFPSRKSS